jgi:hypothetical protein
MIDLSENREFIVFERIFENCVSEEQFRILYEFIEVARRKLVILEEFHYIVLFLFLQLLNIHLSFELIYENSFYIHIIYDFCFLL